jgi:diguanylate cyclase (GGDEF)-like protein
MQEQDKQAENAFDNADKSTRMLEQLTPMARQINCLDLELVAEICISNIPPMVGARFASIYILDENSNILHLLKHNHPFAINNLVSLNQTPPSPMVMAVTSKQVILIGNIDTHKKPVIKKSQRAFAQNYQTPTCAIVPLICQDKVVGVLNLSDKTDGETFESRGDMALIELFSQLIGASIGNIKLFERIQRQATTDGLTGLYNHKTFYETLEKELWRCRRYGGQISMIMVDVDNLKKINDSYGHRAGDKVIKEISRKLKLCIRQIDSAARYGGDEFAVILPNTTLDEATIVAQRMVSEVASSTVTWKKDEIPLSISVGLGQYDAENSPEDITSRSDHALYIAKKAGKNTFRVFKSF